jgi:predicted SAM-dependent methyltransferase
MNPPNGPCDGQSLLTAPMLTLDPPATPTPRLRLVEPRPRTPLRTARHVAVHGAAAALRAAGRCAASLRAGALRLFAAPKLARAASAGRLRLCLGCGDAPIPGWTNIDLGGAADVRLDLTTRLPLPAGSVELVYSEHLIEHLTCEQGVALMRECRRVLAPNGVLRIATPDLEALVDAWRGDWRDQDWVRWPGHEWIDTPARMLNQAFHGWGHRHLYDERELVQRLRDAGFADVRRCAIGASEHGALAGLETRADSKLVVEASGRQETTR